MHHNIGFIQGRLSSLVDGRIQAFPWNAWRDEFRLAEKCQLNMMEWTLDQDRLYENPLLMEAGQQAIAGLCGAHHISIPSLTGDCFMQAPFWKASDSQREDLKQDFLAVVNACAAVGISMIVVPLVDHGRLDDMQQEDTLVGFLEERAEWFERQSLQVIFESDFGPMELSRFISRLESSAFGINYDIGNSAALGFDPVEEITAYGQRIVNVHVKDRVLGGSTVPLGEGDADFERVFSELFRVGYDGNFILQTARAGDGDHAGALCRYRDMVNGWLNQHAA